jgi:excisionase family DNA binding protein
MTVKLLNVKQVQDVLGISERTVFRFIKIGELKGFKVGREWRFEESDIEEYIQRQRKKAD